MTLVVKNLPVHAGDVRDAGLISGWENPLERRPWQPIAVFLPGEAHGEEPSGLQSTELQRVGSD